MVLNSAFFATWTPRALALLRIVTAFVFLQHATAKLFGIPHVAMFDGLQLFSLIGVAGIIELIGGSLVLVGWFTRPAAFILSGEMAVAYFMAHAPQGHVLSPMLNQGELAVIVETEAGEERPIFDDVPLIFKEERCHGGRPGIFVVARYVKTWRHPTVHAEPVVAILDAEGHFV